MKILRWIDKYFEEVLMAALLTGIVLVMFFQIILRFVFNTALPWPEELSRYMFVWLSFLGMSYSVKCKNSLKVDIVETLVPKLKTPLGIIQDLVFLGFAVVIIFLGLDSLQTMWAHPQLSPAARIPMWTVYVSLFVAACLSVIRLIQSLLFTFRDISAKKKEKTSLDVQENL